MLRRQRRGSAGTTRGAALLLAVAVAGTAAACGSSVSPAVSRAQGVAGQVNLQKLDLPAGWSEQQSGQGTSVTTVPLTPSQTKTVDAVIATLPADCQGLRSVFVSSLQGAPPEGALAQSQASFTSAADGNTVISSIVVVFGTAARAGATYSLYAAPSFPACLQSFLGGVLAKIFNLEVHEESVAAAPTAPPPAGVEATGFAVTQSAGTAGQQTHVSTSQEDVVRAGSLMGFLEVQSQTTSIPTDAQTVFSQAVSTVEQRMAKHAG